MFFWDSFISKFEGVVRFILQSQVGSVQSSRFGMASSKGLDKLVLIRKV